ncbi:MAG TPA: glycosyltransferase family 2 protein [Candidatus Saccharimonadales bacterium]|nr:glycosyltransferase family 2 protein [Candidatus Saccharimonadales bacterium]
MISYSAVIPVKDEEGSLPILHERLKKVFTKLGKPYEVIFVDDGSTDNSVATMQRLAKRDKHLTLITFRANFGKSAALAAGLKKAQGEIVIMLDADLQDDPDEIPTLIKKLDEGYDFVNGWRKKRADSFSKKLSSFLFNKGTSFISGVHLHDFNCGLKVFKNEVADELYLHGELHRFIPVLAAKSKFKVTELPVLHHPRKYGKSKYGFGRSWKGILDLFTTIFISNYMAKPAHFFGSIGMIFFTVGFVMDAYVTYIKITTGTTQAKIPLLLAGILLIILGVQLLSIGLIAEMIAYYFYKRAKSDL